MSKRKYFYCEIWGQQIYEEVCMNRYKKGLKKCEGCEKGKALLQLKIDNCKLQIERQNHGIHDVSN